VEFTGIVMLKYHVEVIFSRQGKLTKINKTAYFRSYITKILDGKHNLFYSYIFSNELRKYMHSTKYSKISRVEFVL
jgi:hypothetical protein